MLAKLMIVGLLLSGGTTTLKINVVAEPGVKAPPAVRPGDIGPWPIVGAGAIGGTGVIYWPKGHRLRACQPNLDPDQSAWRELLKEADARLCSVTRVPA